MKSYEVGKRLIWIRENLGLKASDVYRFLKIPKSTFHDRESGLETSNIFDLLKILEFYNERWQEKYLEKYPLFEGKVVTSINLNFIYNLVDKREEEFNTIINILRDNFKEREEELLQRIIALKADLMR